MLIIILPYFCVFFNEKGANDIALRALIYNFELLFIICSRKMAKTCKKRTEKSVRLDAKKSNFIVFFNKNTAVLFT